MFKDTDSMENVNFRVQKCETRSDSDQNMRTPDDRIGVFLGESQVSRDGFGSKPSRPGNSSSPELTCPDSTQTYDKSNEKVGFLRESGLNGDGFESKIGDSGCQELTLSYLCQNSKPDLLGLKGKGVVLENLVQGEKWVERDFLQLSSDSKDGSSKREQEETRGGEGDSSKKPKLETLRLCLAPPDVCLSLTASNAAPNHEGSVQLKPTRSVQSLTLSNNNTQTTCSNDFTAASLSYSYSHPFSHNPSCSLTRNSTENYEHSVGSRRREMDQIWNGGEGTNGSVHSRFKPLGGDGTGLSNHGANGNGNGNGNGVGYTSSLKRTHHPNPIPFNRDGSNSLYRAAGSDSCSFFPSELPAKPKMETYAVESSGRPLDHVRGFASLEDRRIQKPSRGERIVRDVLTEPISVISQMFQKLPVEIIELARVYVKTLLATPERKDEFVELQRLLEQRAELTKETLSKAHKAQLEILIAVKFGINEFVSGIVRLQISELVEIILYMRCRNVNCKSLLPVDDCDCKICSTKKGFCSLCMCPVCSKYDCANNTCSWVGCDTCSHWCHAACGIENNSIRPGPSLKGSSGTTQMQFYCLGCGHASEMFGFVKDVFIYCAKDWGLQTLIKELDCVRRIFKGSEDLKGKELYLKAAELITRLERRVTSPSDACNFIIHFFTTKENASNFSATAIAAKEPLTHQQRTINDTATHSSPNVPSKSSPFSISTASLLQDLLPYSLQQSTPKRTLLSEHRFEGNFSGKTPKKDGDGDGVDSLESVVRIKEAEARMFQNRADEARKDMEAYRELVRAKTEKLEEEYAVKLAKLCLQEADERRRIKVEELKVIETAHSDYCNMKLRMQAEIGGLLERMDDIKQQQWV